MNKQKTIFALACLSGFALLVMVIAGCGGGGGGGAAVTVSNASVSPQVFPTHTGGTLTIRADVVFSAGTGTVAADVTTPGGTHVPVAMAKTTGNTYQGTYQVPANQRTDTQSETYQIVITGTDAANQTASSQTLTARVPSQNAPPVEVTNPTVTPTTLSSSNGGNVVIQANVTSSEAITSVVARVTKPDNTLAQVTMTLQSGTTYRGTYAAPANQRQDGLTEIYRVVVRATDARSQTDDSSQVVFQVPASPAVTDPTASVEELTAANKWRVEIGAEVTGGVGTKTVRARITKQNVVQATINLTESGGRYTGNYEAPANTRTDRQDEVYSVVITATDSTGKSDSSSAVTFNIPYVDLPPPPPPPG